MKGKWKIGILLEAGYQVVPVKDNLEKYIKLTDHIYFQSMLLPYPYSQPLSDTELIYFCDGKTIDLSHNLLRLPALYILHQ